MDDEILIYCVENNPILYDKSHEEYKNLEEKQRVWREMARRLDVDEHFVVRRWTNLREKFTKEWRKFQKDSESGNTSTKQWHLLEKLLFLKHHVIQRPMRQKTPNLRRIPASVDIKIKTDPLKEELEIPMPPATSTATASYSNRKRKIVELDEEETVDNSVYRVRERKRYSLAENQDVKNFGRMMISVILKFGEKKRARIMKDCINIVMEAQMEDDDDDY